MPRGTQEPAVECERVWRHCGCGARSMSRLATGAACRVFQWLCFYPQETPEAFVSLPTLDLMSAL